MFPKKVYMFLNQTCCNRKKIYLLGMLKSYYNMIKGQKVHWSDPIFRAFD